MPPNYGAVAARHEKLPMVKVHYGLFAGLLVAAVLFVGLAGDGRRQATTTSEKFFLSEGAQPSLDSIWPSRLPIEGVPGQFLELSGSGFDALPENATCVFGPAGPYATGWSLRNPWGVARIESNLTVISDTSATCVPPSQLSDNVLDRLLVALPGSVRLGAAGSAERQDDEAKKFSPAVVAGLSNKVDIDFFTMVEGALGKRPYITERCASQNTRLVALPYCMARNSLSVVGRTGQLLLRTDEAALRAVEKTGKKLRKKLEKTGKIQ